MRNTRLATTKFTSALPILTPSRPGIAKHSKLAEYLAALLRGEDPDISQRIARLAETSGRKFFDPAQQDAFPTADFGLCTQLNRFPFALSIRREADGTRVHKIELG